MDFIKQIFTGHGGSYSHKRVITLFAFILFALAFLTNLFLGFPVSEFMVDNAIYIILGGMGIATAEPLANNLLGRDTKKGETPKE